MMRQITFFLVLQLIVGLISVNSFSQHNADHWYFGDKLGLRFSGGEPEILTDGELQAWEGCTSISDDDGNLLFYSNGVKAWNREHELMPNGTMLNGHLSSTQSALIVPFPGYGNQYFLFTVDCKENELKKGLQYSLIDMELENGLGDVVEDQKNIPVLAKTCEKLTAVKHANGYNYWIITHTFGSNSFYVYLLSSDGLDTANPVISNCGQVITDQPAGYLKASPDGTMLAMGNLAPQNLELFYFDDSTGEVSFMLSDPLTRPYGLAFSSNSKVLYATETQLGERRLIQYDLSSGDPNTILNSRNQIYYTEEHSISGMQLAPDYKIYICGNMRDHLSRINKPNIYGSGCEYDNEAIYFGVEVVQNGLPQLPQSIYHIQADFSYSGACIGIPTWFQTDCSRDPDSVLWNFGDPASGLQNTSILKNPTHLFTSSGVFQVELIAYFRDTVDSKTQFVTIYDKPSVYLGNDTSFCENHEFEIQADGNFASWLWSTGDTTSSIITDTAGLFWVEVSNEANCINHDSIYLEVIPISYGQQELNICFGDSVFLQGEYRHEEGFYYDTLLSAFSCDSILETSLGIFDTSLFNQELEICQGDSAFLQGEWQHDPGWYTDVFLNINECDSTVNTHLLVGEIIHAFVDTSICQGDSVFLQGNFQKLEGVYYDTTVAASGCDSVSITQLDVNPVYEMYLDTGICQGDSVFLAGSYRKTAGEYTESYISVSFCDSTVITNLTVSNAYNQQTEYNLCLGDSVFAGGEWQKVPGIFTDKYQSVNGCDSVIITSLAFDSLPEINLGKDTLLEQGERLWLTAYVPGATYLWQDGSQNSEFLVNSSGIYYVFVNNYCGSNSDTISVEYNIPDNTECQIILPNAFSPNGDGLNDMFKPVINCNLYYYRMMIFDRWGSLIYNTSDQNDSWDGHLNAIPVKSGTYIWVIEYNTSTNKRLRTKMHGIVTLI